MENILDKIEKAVNGEITPSEVYAELLGEQEFIESCISRLKPLVLDELEKYPEKEVKLHNLTWQKKAVAGKWDYSGITIWNILKGRIKSVEETAKQVYKAAEAGQQMNVADENGELIPPPNYTPGAQTFAVLKK